jgi:hypothetical protein
MEGEEAGGVVGAGGWAGDGALGAGWPALARIGRYGCDAGDRRGNSWDPYEPTWAHAADAIPATANTKSSVRKGLMIPTPFGNVPCFQSIHRPPGGIDLAKPARRRRFAPEAT